MLRAYNETAKRGALARAIKKTERERKGKSTGGEKGKSGQLSPSQHPQFDRAPTPNYYYHYTILLARTDGYGGLPIKYTARIPGSGWCMLIPSAPLPLSSSLSS